MPLPTTCPIPGVPRVSDRLAIGAWCDCCAMHLDEGLSVTEQSPARPDSQAPRTTFRAIPVPPFLAQSSPNAVTLTEAQDALFLGPGHRQG